ncbi:MAG: MGMT family protein [Candidatus Dependentiae bacterium]|jgi:O-6-methylguanine DNA methyltransferase
MLYYPTLFSLPLQTWQQDYQRFELLYTVCEHDFFGPLFVVGATRIAGKPQEQAMFVAVYIVTGVSMEQLVREAKEYLAPAPFAEATNQTDIDLLANPIKHGGMLNVMVIMKTKLAAAVANAAIRIPFGTTLSYKKLADQLRIPYGARAVGTALGNNQLAYVIPCHRIIRSDGSFGEYRWGAEKKSRLIEWERSVIATQEQKEREYQEQSNIAQG